MNSLNEIIRIDYHEVIEQIKVFILKNVNDANAEGAVLGLSGGVDSSVVLSLLTKILPKKRISSFLLPVKGITPTLDILDSKKMVEKLGINYHIIDISEVADSINIINPNDRVALGNFNARIRMSILYYYANLENKIVIGTGDRSELLIGYFSKYGDGGVDILPIGGLYKSQVKEMAKYLRIPKRIIKKKSSPNLWKDHLAEREIGYSYEIIDPILYLLFDKKLSSNEVSRIVENKHAVDKILEMNKKSYHKRETPRICNIQY